MEFSFSKSQEEFRGKVRKFAQDVLDENIRHLDQHAKFNKQGWDCCAKFGIQGGPIPIEFGGKGQDLMTFVSGLEALGQVCHDNGLMFSICAHIFACELPILAFGSIEQKERWLPDLCKGQQIAAIAIAEEHGASDAFSMLTTATEKNEGYLLKGRKSYVTNAPFCDIALVFARLNGLSNDIICLVVDKNSPGMHRAEATDKMGLRTAPFGDLVFEDCWVPKENRLGSPTSGKIIFMAAMEWERGCLLAPMVGNMQRQVDQCIERVKNRKQGSQSLAKHQCLAHRIADMKVRTEAARLMLYNFVWKKQTRRRAHLEASMSKLFISEAFLLNSLDALQIHGAYGYTCEANLERELRDAVGLRIASGTSDIQRNIIARWLGL
ncbi:acyl-CoA dehydrogenase family protein [bacterium]|nr:acyl-CoA dehydrogenase family protein [bacterium]